MSPSPATVRKQAPRWRCVWPFWQHRGWALLTGLCVPPQVTYQTALAAVFIEGWIFIVLAITGMRTKMIGLVPRTLILAMSVGIGLFLAHIGLQGAEGIGVVTYEPATLVTLGACTAACFFWFCPLRRVERIGQTAVTLALMSVPC